MSAFAIKMASFLCVESSGPKQAVDLGVNSQWEQKHHQPIQMTERRIVGRS